MRLRAFVCSCLVGVALGNPLGAVAAPPAQRAAPPDLCSLMPSGWNVTARNGSDSCTAESGTSQAVILYYPHDTTMGSDFCKEKMQSFKDSASGPTHSAGVGDCAIVTEWSGLFRPVTDVYFLVLDGPSSFYQVYVKTEGDTQPDESTVLDPAREIESKIRAAMGGSAPPASAQTGLPLCPEAVSLYEGFAKQRMQAAGITDPLHTSILMNNDFLVPDFQTAVLNYNGSHPDAQAYVTWSTQQVATLLWLFSNGGILPNAITRQFITGHEAELMQAIIQKSAEKAQQGDAEPRLSPGEVFELALELSGGDANAAMLTAHNTLRALARGDAATGGSMGVIEDLEFFKNYLVPVRGADDNAGPWYHMFGTGYMEMVSRGDWSPYVITAGAVAAGLVSAPFGLVLVVLSQSKVNTESTVTSRVYNGLEQWYREDLDPKPKPPDPEKFCFNLWGAEIGNMLYDSLPVRGTQGFSEPPFSDFARPDTQMPNFDAIRSLADARFAHVVRSPYSVEWRDSNGSMLLDQTHGLDQAQLMGGLPYPMYFVPEEDTWAIVWFSSDEPGQQVTFEATDAGADLHYDRIDLQTGESAQYTTTSVNAGDRWQLPDASVSTPPDLVADDGSLVHPQITHVDLPADNSAPGSTFSLPASNILLAVGGVGLLGLCCIAALVLLGGVVLVLRRRRR